MALSLRDRFFTPPVARAMTSPLGIVLAGAGAAVAIVAGAPAVVAVVAGAAAWGARVAAAIPRAPSRERIDPFTLTEPWRTYVREAQEASTRFATAIAATRPGPLRDRLTLIGERIDDGVRECWRIANRGAEIEGALGRLDTRSVRAELERVERERALPTASTASLDRTAEALQAQLASADRLSRVAVDARDRLRLLDARLDEAVARAIELSVGTQADVGGLTDDVDGLVAELEALRSAIDDAGTPPVPPSRPVTG